jgi:hypothetical protein
MAVRHRRAPGARSRVASRRRPRIERQYLERHRRRRTGQARYRLVSFAPPRHVNSTSRPRSVQPGPHPSSEETPLPQRSASTPTEAYRAQTGSRQERAFKTNRPAPRPTERRTLRPVPARWVLPALSILRAGLPF